MRERSDETKELREAYEYDEAGWAPIRAEARKDMRYVAGDPWDDDDKAQRANRPTVAPEELSQYRNQVINALMANPRGGKFSPVGNGATDKGAQFYQNKWREIEYRSHATQAYLIAADNALQRSYGYVRVNVGYQSPRSANQDLSIEAFPNPDMVLPDFDALRYDSGDMKRCFVKLWMGQAEFKQKFPNAKVRDFSGWQTGEFSQWVRGNKVQLAEYWQIRTRPRTLLLVQPRAGTPSTNPLQPTPPSALPVQLFADELQDPKFLARHPDLTGAQVLRELRAVDYPEVVMQLTNGIEILSEHPWLGKYIPIVSCYGKVLYVEGDQGMERIILSMTRFGREPWKAYCYACSQELEVLAMVPKSPLMVARGQMDANQLALVKKSMHEPVAALTYDAYINGNMTQPLPPPKRVDYVQGEYLQALELVKEGYRRAIQAAMGSNFLPTQAQRRNEKSGIALDKIDQVAAQGTYHFVYAYDGLIRQTGVVGEDLIDKIHDYRGELGVLEADLKATTVRINDPGHPDAIDTAGDYLFTVSTAPSSDSEREAAAEFTDALISRIQLIAEIAGPKVAAAIFARAVRMRNLGPQGDALADLIEPPEFKTPDGEAPNPQLQAAKVHIQHLTQLLQQAAQEKQAKVVEQQGKFQIVKYQTDAASQDKAADREVKLAIAELGARVDRLALFLEESRLVGVRRHDATEAARDRVHQAIEGVKDRAHEHIQADLAHTRAIDLADQAAAHARDQAVQQAALAPAPLDGAAA